MLINKFVLSTTLLVTFTACSKKSESTASKPATCAVAGQMVAKRLGELADKAKVTGEKRAQLDMAMADAITARCTADAWNEATLGCLGAMATIREGEVPVATYNDGIDICTKAIGDENQKKLDAAVGEVVRSVVQGG